MSETTLDEQLAKMREAKEAKAKAAKEAAALRELEEFNLEQKYEAELGGPRGVAFELVDATAFGGGFVVLKLGARVLWTRLQASKVTDGDIQDFCAPCVVHPSKEDFKALVMARPGLLGACGKALGRLYGVEYADERGK